MKKDLKIFTTNIEQEAKEQIDLLLKQTAFKNSKIRIMPDVHQGMGCVIGFTGNLGEKLIPNIVGVDIGCGLLTLNLGKIKLDLKQLDEVINKYIPSGFKVHKKRSIKFNLNELKCYPELNDPKRLERSIGTLGGGNHFIEVNIDHEDNLYLIIHTGSRNLGNQVAKYYQKLAIQTCPDKSLPKDLAYLEGSLRDDYLHDMNICVEFASLNRQTIADIIVKHLNLKIIDSFETIHNYIDLSNNIVRKGAISAKKGELLTIPINMRDGCIIGLGKGNPDWNYSAPHGAGRLMSRMQARKTVCFESFKNSMAGIYSTSINRKTIDEAPCVYKPINEILDNVNDTIEVLKVIKPLYNYKASD